MIEENVAPPLTPGAGDLTSVVQRGVASPVSAEGTFAGQRGFQVMVTFTGGCPFTAEEDVLLACGEMGGRIAALARFKELRGSNAVFSKLSPWRPVDTRSHPRFQTHMRANVRRKTGNLHGTIVDISRGGLSLAVDEVPGGAAFDVRVGTRHGSPYLPCRLLSRQERDGHTVLHLRFESLDAPSGAYVERLVGELCTAMEPGLLAS
jgi:hypothetical protein